ncbi:pentapeptide repeat-containing protein [Streptomyces sp. NPDC048419]|uniref:pentapeptide repeat-containing protein n=1 Tax=Streptomyces sp. NPDC048419 TaxID=3365547 RepID=UPI0037156124
MCNGLSLPRGIRRGGIIAYRQHEHPEVVVAGKGLVRRALREIKIKEAGPKLALVEKLRELYGNSNWKSLTEFRDAIGRHRSGEEPPSVTTLSRYLSGDRPVTSDFLEQMFDALDEGKSEQEQLADDVKQHVLGLYFDSIAKSQPAKHRLFQREQDFREKVEECEGHSRLIEELHEEIEQARAEHDRLNEQLETVTWQLENVAGDRNKLKKEQTDLLSERAELKSRIDRLHGELKDVKEDRNQACKERDELAAAYRVERRAATDERQALLEETQEQTAALKMRAREAEERCRVLESQLTEVRQALAGPGHAPEPTAVSVADDTLRNCHTRLASRDTENQHMALNELGHLLREDATVRGPVVDALCQFIRQAREQRTTAPVVSIAVNLVAAHLRSAHPLPIDLAGATLKAVDLSTCNLRSARLSGICLEGVSLRGADLTGADLRGADLFRVDLQQATLTDADLSGATGLEAADLEETVDARKATLPDNLELSRRRLRQIVIDRPGYPVEEKGLGRLLEQARLRTGKSMPQVSRESQVPLHLVHGMERGTPVAFQHAEQLWKVARHIDADRDRITRLWRRLEHRRRSAAPSPRRGTAAPAPLTLPGLLTPPPSEHLQQAHSPEIDALKQARLRQQQEARRAAAHRAQQRIGHPQPLPPDEHP